MNAQFAHVERLELSAKERFVAANKARGDFYFYARYMMLRRHGRRWMRAQHHPVVCAKLMQVFRGEILRLLINMPPRYSKTQLVTDFIEYCLGHHPDAEFMYLSYSAEMATDKTGDALDDVCSEAYKEIFPSVEVTSNARGHWKTSAGGVVYAAGAAGTVTGLGAGKMREGFGGALIFDDPHKPDEVFSPTIRQGVIDRFKNTVESRLNWYNTPIIIIAHCLHEEDIIAWLKGYDPKTGRGGNGEPWEVLSLPAISDEGTALWPEKHSIEELRRKQKAAPYEFASQYMQRPTPIGGAYFHRENFLVDGEPVEMPDLLDCVFAVIDTANKAGSDHDGLGVVYFGKRPPDVLGLGPLVILDWDYTQIEGALLIDWLPTVFTRLEELARDCRALQGSLGAWIEDKGSGIVLNQQVANKGLPAQPIPSGLTAIGKAPRCFNVSGYVHTGDCKATREAWEKTVEYKGESKNHLFVQIFRFSPSTGDQGADDLLDCFTCGVALGMGNSDGF